MNRVNLARLACLQLGIATVALSGSAVAVTRNITNISNPAGVCQGALPTFDGLIRKRPLAIQNEGSSDAFVTCALTQSWSGNNATRVDIYARSHDGLEHTVTCTAVTSFATASNQFVTKTATVTAGGAQESMSWVPADFTGSTTNLPSYLFSISCLLPPGSGLNDTHIINTIDVGS